MASIVLPTYEWTESCEALHEQVTDADELLVAVDTETAPAASAVADRTQATLVVAGEPDGCSGKCNAVAAAIEASSDDVLILTDDDVPRDDDWLARVKRGVEEHGAVTGAPLYVHQGGSGRVLGWLDEPAQAFGSLLLLLGNGVWGGAAGFHRDHIDDMETLVRDLRRTVTDDLLIGEHLTTDRKADFSLATTIPVTTSASGFLDRMVRYRTTFEYSEEAPAWMMTLLGVLQLLALVVWTLPAVVLMLLGGLATYRVFGTSRWTVVFAPVSLLFNAVLDLYAATRKEFEWGGRRYRWPSKFEVDVVEES